MRSTMQFPLASGMQSWAIDGAFLNSSMRILVGPDGAALTTFLSKVSENVMNKQAGFSPFGTYTFDLAPLRNLNPGGTNPFTQAYELLLVFQLDPSPSPTGTVKGVPQCGL
jgi:hypothetical protein